MSGRYSVDITPKERVGRALVGIAGVVGAILLLAGLSGVLAGVLAVLLGLAGRDLLVTGPSDTARATPSSVTFPSLRRP